MPVWDLKMCRNRCVMIWWGIRLSDGASDTYSANNSANLLSVFIGKKNKWRLDRVKRTWILKQERLARREIICAWNPTGGRWTCSCEMAEKPTRCDVLQPRYVHRGFFYFEWVEHISSIEHSTVWFTESGNKLLAVILKQLLNSCYCSYGLPAIFTQTSPNGLHINTCS